MSSSVRQQRDPRVPFEQPVWVGVRDTTGPIRRLWAANLSKGGMFVKTAAPLALGEEVIVALEGTDEILPLAEARVVWQRPRQESSPAGVGLAFTGLKPEADRILQELIETHGGEEPPLDSAAWPEPVTPAISPAAAARQSAAAPVATPDLDLDPLEMPTPPVPLVPQAFWTELFLPHRARIRVRLMAGTLRLDFGEENVVESVIQEGNTVLIDLA